MSNAEEERIRKVEDTLLLIPTEFNKITSTQKEIVEHLETINGTFGEFEERLHSVETKWDYQEKDDDKKKEKKREFLNFGNFILAGVIATQAIIVSVLALS